MNTEQRIVDKCGEISDMLVEKNRAYGDSALNPVKVFSCSCHSPAALIKIRLDDKLGRIKNNPSAFGEDPIKDLIGYLILLLLAIEDESSKG